MSIIESVFFSVSYRSRFRYRFPISNTTNNPRSRTRTWLQDLPPTVWIISRCRGRTDFVPAPSWPPPNAPPAPSLPSAGGVADAASSLLTAVSGLKTSLNFNVSTSSSNESSSSTWYRSCICGMCVLVLYVRCMYAWYVRFGSACSAYVCAVCAPLLCMCVVCMRGM